MMLAAINNPFLNGIAKSLMDGLTFGVAVGFIVLTVTLIALVTYGPVKRS